ncbi:MAG: ATP synthase subunit I [Calditrichaceae bacterium]
MGLCIILTFYAAVSWGVSKTFNFNEQQDLGLFLAGIFSTLNIVAAYFIIMYSLKKDQKEFAKIFLTGMVIRILILLIIIFIIISYSQVEDFVFLSGLFILYFIYQIWEILILNRTLKKGY